MESTVRLNFLGAANVVTGSKFLLETSECHIMIDCGMFQGIKELRELNWAALPVDVPNINVVLLTHGHLDHVGYLPRLLQQGFEGDIIGTAPTLAIAEIILRDSAKIHEEEAEKANREQYTSHNPALPFFTQQDAERTIRLFKDKNAEQWHQLSAHIKFRFRYNGHIIGACFIELDVNNKRFVFSGDIGRRNDYLLRDPLRPEWADYVIIEGTYGNKLHPEEDVEERLVHIIKETIHNKGNLVIPSFAVERLQTLMYILWKLYNQRRIPNIPIFVDSPMGTNVLQVFNQFPDWHKLPMSDYNAMCYHVNIVESYKETWETIDDPRSKIIIAGSGMVTGGRVLTYLQQMIDDPTTTVLLVGFQAEGTRGRQLQDGVHEIRFFGKYYPVKARIVSVESLSAHGDQKDLLFWLSALKNVPEKIYLVHGEPMALDAFRVKLQDKSNVQVTIPKLTDVDKLLI